MADGRIGLGVFGCGGFGLFALQQFTQVPGMVELVDEHRPRHTRPASVAAAAPGFGVKERGRSGRLSPPRQGLDLVYIATPPTFITPRRKPPSASANT